MVKVALGLIATAAVTGVIACCGGGAPPVSAPATPTTSPAPMPPPGTRSPDASPDATAAASTDAPEPPANTPKVEARELEAYVKENRLWRNFVVPPGTGGPALGDLARRLHAEDPGS